MLRSQVPCQGRPLLPQFREPVIQDRNTAGLYRREPDPHPSAVPCVRDPSLGGEDRSVMRDSESDLCSVRERLRRLDKTPEEAQILRMCCDHGSSVEVGDLHPGDKGEAVRAVALERDGVTSLVFPNSIPPSSIG